MAVLTSACAGAAPPTDPAPPSPAPAGVVAAPRDAGAVMAAEDAGAPLEPADAAADVVDAAPTVDASPPRRHAFHQPPPSASLPVSSPARRFANLYPKACRAEARRRKLAVSRDRRPTPGVATAFRMKGSFRGVTFRTAGRKSRFGVFDCRLALAFDEMAAVLADHDVDEVLVGTIYRPGSKLGRRVRSQHAHGLAADVVGFRRKDGKRLLVERDWPSAIGEPACGPDARLHGSSEEAIALRNIVCDLHRRGLFHHILTPNYDAAHHDHLHLDIKRGALRRIIR